MFNNEFTGGEVVVISTQCDGDAMWYEDKSENTRCEIYLDGQNPQASIGSAIKGSAGCFKAGLGHGVVLGIERERDGVSNRGVLRRRISTKFDIVTS